MNSQRATQRVAATAFAALCIAALLVLVTGSSDISAQGTDLDFGVDDVTTVVGEDVTVEIKIGEQATQAGAGLAHLNYDTTALDFVSCTKQVEYLACDEVTEGIVSFATVTGTNFADDTVLAEVVFTALATNYDGGTITMDTDEWLAESGEALSASFVGQAAFVVEVGDANCSERRDIGDALFIAQYTVGNRQATASCPIPAGANLVNLGGGDMNHNGATDIADALFIAQCEVGIDNGHC